MGHSDITGHPPVRLARMQPMDMAQQCLILPAKGNIRHAINAAPRVELDCYNTGRTSSPAPVNKHKRQIFNSFIGRCPLPLPILGMDQTVRFRLPYECTHDRKRFLHFIFCKR